MNLSERKKKILSAVIDESIKTAEPVSSKDVQEKYMKEYSPATIRNELMALEEMGFLSQPHTSSGRIPTAQGYKMYVDELMQERKLNKKEVDLIKINFDQKLSSLDDLLQKAAKTISDATNYASVVYFGITDNAVIDNIILMRLTKSQTLVVIVTDLGIIKEQTSIIDNNEQELLQASKILTELFKGKKLEEVKNSKEIVTEELIRYKAVFDAIIDIITKREGNFNKNMAVSGKDNLLNYPEYHDIEKLRKTIGLLDQKESLFPLLDTSDSDIEISVKVGGENDFGLTDCSIVTATYKAKGKPIGSANVVGPVRMDYAKVVSILKNVTQILENNLFDE